MSKIENGKIIGKNKKMVKIRIGKNKKW